MFLLRQGSRNTLNNNSKEAGFRTNYEKVFGMRLPHMDTVEDFLRRLEAGELETLKATLVAGLINQKVLRQFKLLGKHYTIAIDATGTNSYQNNDAGQTRLSKKSKNGKISYHYYVLEAKLITATGLAISLASEWVTNLADRNFDKQDCEHRAFERLSVKLKKYFPRLPVCLLADGLYPNNTFMQICAGNGWQYIVVLKDDSLKTLQQDVTDTENKLYKTTAAYQIGAKGKTHVQQQYKWIATPFKYGKDMHSLYWFSCTETIRCYDEKKTLLPGYPSATKFVWLSSQKVTEKNVKELAEAGRNRWKIENEGFNVQKNGGYGLGHKYARRSFLSYQNYYQCLQIAHLVSQLTEHGSTIQNALKENRKLTIKHLWQQAVSWLIYAVIEASGFTAAIQKCQIRLKT